LAQSGHYGRADPRPLSGVKRTNIDIKGVLDFIDLLPPRLPLWPNLRDDRPANSKAAAPLMRLAMTFPAQHDAIKQRRIRAATVNPRGSVDPHLTLDETAIAFHLALQLEWSPCLPQPPR
jgi:hypothetical protein